MASLILKEVLSLSAKHEASVWRSIEQKLVPALTELSTYELVRITNHFGTNHQGTNAFWKEIDSRIVKVFPNLSADQTFAVIDGFGEAPESYELSEQLDSLLSMSRECLGKLALLNMQESDPYFSSNILTTFNAGSPDWIRSLQYMDNDDSHKLHQLNISHNNSDECQYDMRPVQGTTIRFLEERQAFFEAELAEFEKVFSKHVTVLDQIRSN